MLYDKRARMNMKITNIVELMSVGLGNEINTARTAIETFRKFKNRWRIERNELILGTFRRARDPIKHVF